MTDGSPPGHQEHFALARAHWARQERDASLASLDAALAAKPDFVDALDAKAHLLARMGRHAESVAVARHLQSLAPARDAALLEASGLSRLNRHDEALAAAARVPQPAAPVDCRLIAAVHSDAGFAVESLEFYRRAIAADPHDLRCRALELFFSNFDERTRLDDLYARHRDYGALLEAGIAPQFLGRWQGAPDKGRRLRVGIVSADLGDHPVAMFLRPLLERIDRSGFEVWCYSGLRAPEVANETLRRECAAWIDAGTLDDEQLAARIHADRIDVLLDLSGHSGRPRIAVFARVPAPVQMTWLGYLNTTGLTRIGWRLCDNRTDPASTQRWHTETLLPFAASQWCYRPPVEEPPGAEPPCIANGYVTFGSFNNPAKIGESMCERWARVILRCAGSRMLIAGIKTQAMQGLIAERLERSGIDRARLTFAPQSDVRSFARLVASVDIALDTHPYGGGTTTLDTLWMGVPVFTLKGELPVSRSASSILELLGLGEWVTHSPDHYVEQVVERAGAVGEIARLRKQLRRMLQASALMDEAGYTRAFERALRMAWEEYCDRTPQEAPTAPASA